MSAVVEDPSPVRRHSCRVRLQAWVFCLGLAVWSPACGDDEEPSGTADTGGGDAADVGGDALEDTSPDGTEDSTVQDVPAEADTPIEDGVEPDGTPGESFRIAVIADPYITGNDIKEWNIHLNLVVDALNAEDDLDFVLVLGDLAISLADPFISEENAAPWAEGFEEALAILGNLDVPYYFAPGDRDYADHVEFGPARTVQFADRAERTGDLHEGLGDAWPGEGSLYAFSHKGMRFVGLSTMAGPRAEEGSGVTGSLGDEQLDLLEQEMAEAAEPMIVFSHHPLQATFEDESVDPAMERVAAQDQTVLWLFHGHMFRYSEYRVDNVDALGFHAVRENPAFWAVVEIDPSVPSVTVVNRESLPFAEEPGLEECVPGGDVIGAMPDLAETYHALFFDSFTTDDPILNSLIANYDFSNAITIRVDGQTEAAWQTTMSYAGSYHQYHPSLPEAGDHALVPAWDVGEPPCELEELAFADPCATAEFELTLDFISMADTNGIAHFCGVPAPYTFEAALDLTLGTDSDGNTSFAEVRGTGVAVRDDIIAGLRAFVVDAYCHPLCEVPGAIEEPRPILTGEACDAQVNGDGEACEAETLTFEDVPVGCDYYVGDAPVRTILRFAELVNEEVLVTLSGFGHEMTLVDDDPSVDWSLDAEIYGEFLCNL